jgi:hypothetical protein
LSGVGGPFGAQLRQIRLNLKLIPGAAEIIFDARAREGKKRLVDEVYRRRRALDVEKNKCRRRFVQIYVRCANAGIEEAPKQSG